MDPISFSLGMLGAFAVGKVYATLIKNMHKEEAQWWADQEELIEAEKRMRAYYDYK